MEEVKRARSRLRPRAKKPAPTSPRDWSHTPGLGIGEYGQATDVISDDGSNFSETELLRATTMRAGTKTPV